LNYGTTHVARSTVQPIINVLPIPSHPSMIQMYNESDPDVWVHLAKVA